MEKRLSMLPCAILREELEGLCAVERQLSRQVSRPPLGEAETQSKTHAPAPLMG